ncbi:MAG: zf-HC2 domain-containing protein [Ignavibacteriales bacterium]|nr:zf-HC2 domain-containing protein [Ignavibacteriales bacterium]
MNCEEVKISLHDYVDESLDGFLKREVETHLRGCDKCFNEYKKIRIFFDTLKNLPYTIEPPKEIVEIFSAELLSRSLKEELPESAAPPVTNLRRLKKEQAKQDKTLRRSQTANRKSVVSQTIMTSRISHSLPSLGINWSRIIFILLPLVLFAVGYFIYDIQKNNSPWKVNTKEGSVVVNGIVDNPGKIRQGESLLTESDSKAAILVPGVGNIDIDENSLLLLEKAKDGDNRIRLKKGNIKIVNMSTMPDLAIDVGNCVVLDRSGQFSISIDDNNIINIFVEFGFVEIQHGDQTVYLNEDYNCEIISGNKIGVPYRSDASDKLIEEAKNFDYNRADENTIQNIIKAATAKDMLTLLELIPRTSELHRLVLFQAIANNFPPPENVTRAGIIKGDVQMLYLWWQEIEWQI